MKVLLTGATGFLGKTIEKIISKKMIVFSLSRTNGHYKCFLEKEIPVFNEFFDLVIHAAGKAHELANTNLKREEFYSVNVLGTINLLKGLEKKGIPKYFIFISSVSVYGLDYGININETHPLEAKDAYGLSKIECEKLIIEWCQKNGVIYTILRLPLLVGKNPPGNLAKMIKGIKKGYYFNIDGGKAKKSMVLTNDVAQVIPEIMTIGGIYNLTDGVHPDFYNLSILISKQNKKNVPFNIPLKIARIMGYIGDLLGANTPINSSKLKKITSNLTFDDSKIRKDVGWQSQSVLEYLENNTI